LGFNGQAYLFTLYVNALERESPRPEDYVFDLPEDDAFMVLRVAQQTADGPQVIFQRKLVCGLEYEAADMALVFRMLRVDRRNLNGSGAFGSQVVGGIAAR
jgi:hypothetical protein